MKVGICGFGWVGKAMYELFPDALVYDPFMPKNRDTPNLCYQEEINECDVAFIAVPTPCIKEGRLDTSIVEESINWCKCPLLVVRSTVNPGDCDSWTNRYEKNICMQPEYLGESVNHPMTDQKSRPFLIIGGEPENRRKLIELYQSVYNANISIRQVTNYEAEVIKLSENRAIAFKVLQCQELYDVCELAGVDYYTIQQAVYGDDPRFELWWTFVYPDKRGANSKCIPKDVNAWCYWAEVLGYDPEITRALLKRNKKWISR